MRPDQIAFPSTGYAQAAVSSYATFARLRDEGRILPHTRFQVSLPTTSAFLNAVIAPESQGQSAAGYERRLLADVAEICAAIPPEDLAVQWDVSTEMAIWEGIRPDYLGSRDMLIASVQRHCNAVPESVELGVHLCYGDFGHKHWAEPVDTANLVEVANRMFAGLRRTIQWLHLPVPRDRTEAAYFAPLRRLRLPAGCELYLGLVHLTDGVAGGRLRIEAAKTAITGFGIACECGFGRRPRETIPDLLRLHAELAVHAM